VAKLAPHDLRRTCARLCHASGGELEQTQFLVGTFSVPTTRQLLSVTRWTGTQDVWLSIFKRLLLQFGGPVLHEGKGLTFFLHVPTVDKELLSVSGYGVGAVLVL
jgi:hypothetical protein